MHSSFNWTSAGIIVAYVATVTLIGVYFSKRQKGLDDFFLAGKSMSWLPIGLSLMAALNSGIDYLMVPSAGMKYGLIIVVGSASWLVVFPWISKITLPFYRRLNFYSAYEYLEARFDVRVRTLAAVIFILWRLGWMATAMYVPCLAINSATNGAVPLMPMVMVLGTIVTIYTMLGGIKAVIWIEVLQFCVMMAGLSATVIFVILHTPGGLPEIWRVAEATGKTQIYTPLPGADQAGFWKTLQLFFLEPLTIIGLLLAAVVGRLTVYTSDQVMVQRLQTTRSVKDARQAFIINACTDTFWMCGLAFVGLAILAYVQLHSFPEGLKADQIFPQFMSSVFPSWLMGGVIAAIVAASLSSVGSAVNSCTTVVIIDFYYRIIRGQKSIEGQKASFEDSKMQIRISRITTVFLGVFGTLLASSVGNLGNLIEISCKVVNLLTGCLFGTYLLGMFTRTASATAVLIGGLCGCIVTVYTAFFTKISFLWPPPIGLAVTLVVGYALSLVWARPTPEQIQLTFRNTMRRGAGPNELEVPVPLALPKEPA